MKTPMQSQAQAIITGVNRRATKKLRNAFTDKAAFNTAVVTTTWNALKATNKASATSVLRELNSQAN